MAFNLRYFICRDFGPSVSMVLRSHDCGQVDLCYGPPPSSRVCFSFQVSDIAGISQDENDWDEFVTRIAIVQAQRLVKNNPVHREQVYPLALNLPPWKGDLRHYPRFGLYGRKHKPTSR